MIFKFREFVEWLNGGSKEGLEQYIREEAEFLELAEREKLEELHQVITEIENISYISNNKPKLKKGA